MHNPETVRAAVIEFLRLGNAPWSEIIIAVPGMAFDTRNALVFLQRNGVVEYSTVTERYSLVPAPTFSTFV